MNKSVLEKAMGLSIWTPKLWILLGSSLDPCSLGGIFDCKQDRLIWTSPKSATKLSFLGLDKIETYCSPFLRCFPLQRMENPSYQNSKPMCQCVFLDFKSGCLKIHGRTNLEPTFSLRFHSLEYFEFLWRHQFAKLAIHDPSRHLTMKSSRLHGIWASRSAWVAWVMTQLRTFTALRTTRGYSATVWWFRNPKNNHLTCLYETMATKMNICIPYQLVIISGILYQHLQHFMQPRSCMKTKNPESAILPSPSISMFWNVSLLWDCLFFPHRAATFQRKISKNWHPSKPTCQRKWCKATWWMCTTKNNIRDVSGWLHSKISAWWLNQPIWKILVKMEIFPKEGWK